MPSPVGVGRFEMGTRLNHFGNGAANLCSTGRGLPCRRATSLQLRIATAGDGSQLRFAVRVEVKIPLVGGKLEKSIGANLAENIPAVLRFTTTWIAEHA